MKKITALLLIFIMALGMLAGCGNPNKIDIDLTKEGTNVHEVLEEITSNPENYIGKKVKIRGLFAADTEKYNDGTATREKFAVIITDSHDEDGCNHGVAFSLDDSINYLPSNGTEVIVIGTFDKYSEKGVWHYHIAKAVWGE